MITVTIAHPTRCHQLESIGPVLHLILSPSEHPGWWYYNFLLARSYGDATEERYCFLEIKPAVNITMAAPGVVVFGSDEHRRHVRLEEMKAASRKTYGNLNHWPE